MLLLLCCFQACFIVVIFVIFSDITLFRGVNETIGKLKVPNMFTSQAITLTVSYIVARNIDRNIPLRHSYKMT